MDRNLLWIFAAAGLCLCAVNAHVQRRYHFVYDFMNMTEAQSYCREKYSDLATVESEEDMELLRNMADLSRMTYPGGNSDRAWIGLYDDISSWRWSLLERSFYKPGETEFRNWWPGEPNNKKGEEHCVELYDNGQWNDDSCDTQLQPVCCDVTGSDVTFVLINTSMSWTEAQSYCRNHHTDLAWVKNTTDNQRVKDLVSGQKVWIGLSRESWKWSDGSQSTFRFWKQESKEPNNNFENETCVSADFSSSGRWEDWNCDYKRTFVCQSPNVTFVLITDDMTWTEAQSYCREHYTDLASVRNMAENEEIKDMIPFLNEVWIGLYRESWKWFDGSDSTFRDWNLGFSEPNNLYSKESCVAADFGNSGKWEDWPCGYRRAFICHTAGITKQVFRLSVQKMSPSPDLRDPAVMEDVFEQLQQKLKDEGLNENIELSWRKQPDGNILQKVETKEEEEEEEGMSHDSPLHSVTRPGQNLHTQDDSGSPGHQDTADPGQPESSLSLPSPQQCPALVPSWLRIFSSTSSKRWAQSSSLLNQVNSPQTAPIRR
ncbi:macrophage mannose receptor 1-like [Xyrichtys novacula]|uniref:Macrophage mannose receptor 1-like n=1 Tax=Xyrichtys novacula TaxID=13765 RepID=A0AAV1HFF9_XYRNO|nr:macrophage mannose receptor 1-like [Xyrichtys novacula]